MENDSRGILLLCYGNPAREDDGLGPALAAEMEQAHIPGLTVDADYQLQAEDAVAASRHKVVIFADAAMEGEAPFVFRKLPMDNDYPAEELHIESHRIEPQWILGLARLLSTDEREGYLLGIRGYSFNHFTEGIGGAARRNLDKAKDFVTAFIRKYGEGESHYQGGNV